MQLTNTKELQKEAWQSGKGDLQGIVQEIQIWPYEGDPLLVVVGEWKDEENTTEL